MEKLQAIKRKYAAEERVGRVPQREQQRESRAEQHSVDKKSDGLRETLPPLSSSLDLSGGKGLLARLSRVSPKRSPSGSVERLPKASENASYTIDKFVAKE